MNCPFCAEEIQPEARKCRHCGEWLSEFSGSISLFDVILTDPGEQIISVIKFLRQDVGIGGLKEAKDLVTSAPQPILRACDQHRADELITRLQAIGASAEAKIHDPALWNPQALGPTGRRNSNLQRQVTLTEALVVVVIAAVILYAYLSQGWLHQLFAVPLTAIKEFFTAPIGLKPY